MIMTVNKSHKFLYQILYYSAELNKEFINENFDKISFFFLDFFEKAYN